MPFSSIYFKPIFQINKPFLGRMLRHIAYGVYGYFISIALKSTYYDFNNLEPQMGWTRLGYR